MHVNRGGHEDWVSSVHPLHFPIMNIPLTEQQRKSLEALPSKGWTPQMDTIMKLPCEEAIAVLALAGPNHSIYFVIEPDGYTHS